jgi:hypothetical protein
VWIEKGESITIAPIFSETIKVDELQQFRFDIDKLPVTLEGASFITSFSAALCAACYARFGHLE